MGIKNCRWFLFPIALIMLNSCSSQASAENIRVRKGIVYIKSHEEPFTGYLIGESEEGYRRITCSFIKRSYRFFIKVFYSKFSDLVLK